MAAVPVVFADLYKPVKDFFSKGYVAPSVRWELKAKAADGYLQVTNETTEKTSATSADFEQVFPTNYGFITGKVVVNAGTRFQPSIKVRNAFGVKNLAIGVNGDQPIQSDKRTPADKVEATVELNNLAHYTKGVFNLTNSFAEISSTIALSKVLVGASTKVGFNGAVSNYTAGASYKTPLMHLLATFNQVLKDKSYTATVGALYNYNKWIVGGQLIQTAKGSAILLGTETICNGTVWRAKANTKGVISASAQHKFGSVVGTVGGDIDAARAATSNVGIKFVWEQ